MVAILFVAHTCLVGWVSISCSPNADETAHLAAGGLVWRAGRFDLYPVNPPLVRMVAAFPLTFNSAIDWSALERAKEQLRWEERPEWTIGAAFVRDNAHLGIGCFSIARLACIPFGLVGAYFCWRWAWELYGALASVLTLTLWCFSPNVIAWSATIGPDAASASLGVFACYFFWKWLKQPNWCMALSAGMGLGLAELTKMTWLILFFVWPLIWLVGVARLRFGGVDRVGEVEQSDINVSHSSPPALQLFGILAIGLFVLNMGYGFSGSFTSLSEYTFVSKTLAGEDSVVSGGNAGNQFAEYWWSCLPIPLPRDYVQGADLQRVDFERGLRSFLFGRWSQHGWWYYYIACATLKIPLGVWAMGILTVGASLVRLCVTTARPSNVSQNGSRTNSVLSELALLVPAVSVCAFVSSQAGFSRHFRYVLPAFPFLFVWIGSIAREAMQRPWSIGLLVVGSLVWTVASSMFVYPHSMSYFNELAGGPKGGVRHLLDANIDWGQDIMFLKKWHEANPGRSPLKIGYRYSYSAALMESGGGAERHSTSTLCSLEECTENTEASEWRPAPGWYAVSVHRMHDPRDSCHFFQKLTPVASVGYSILIFEVTSEDSDCVARLRHGEGLDDDTGGR